jgi:diguanylate cyclase (GGDEF)-like protein
MLTVRRRLLVVALIAAGAFATVGGVGVVTAARVGHTASEERRMVELQETYLRSDIFISKLRGQVYEAAAAGDDRERQEALEEYTAMREELATLMVSTLRSFPEGALLPAARAVHEAESEFLTKAELIIDADTSSSVAAAGDDLQELDVLVDALDERITSLTAEITGLQHAATARTTAARAAASRIVLAASLLGVLVLTALLVLAIRSILSGLGGVTAAANRLADGDFEARVDTGRGDEIGDLGLAFNATANNLQAMMRRLEEQGERDTFGRQLTEALEMADTEEATFVAISRSLSAVSVDHPTELLIADSSRAHLEVRAEHPVAGAPGCPVESPFGCVAVRRGTATSFPDDRALDACPMLRDRGCTPYSAVCVPVTFMGRAIGVLHTTAPIEQPPDVEEVGRLATLAGAAGARIGTVRSFERTQLQASTDALTGLMNRRMFETSARHLIRDRKLAAIVMTDLDHFKRINDTQGHEAGDTALKMFTELLRNHVRREDVVARYGGEEFVLLLPGVDAPGAVEVLERFRILLADATLLHPPAFTASFGVTDTREPDSLAGLVRRADAALYEAKSRGRNCIVVDQGGSRGHDLARTDSLMQRAMFEDDPFIDVSRLP